MESGEITFAKFDVKKRSRKVTFTGTPKQYEKSLKYVLKFILSCDDDARQPTPTRPSPPTSQTSTARER